MCDYTGLMIEPISPQQQQQVRAATDAAIDLAGRCLSASFDYLPVDFDLSGRCAGMYQVRRGRRRIRYNPWIFAKYYVDSLKNTVIHEVAHYVVDCCHGHRSVKPHGAEWRGVMRTLGAEPEVRGDYELEDIPQRNYRKFNYACICRSHLLTSIRHGRIQQQGAEYRCRRCSTPLRLAAESP